jgi:hypothetical protein
VRSWGLALTLLGLVACAPTHLELARRHHEAAQTAQAEGDSVAVRTAYEQSAAEARRSIAAEEEGEKAAQAWLLVAWARLALGQMADAEEALREVREAGLEPSRPWQRRVLVAAHCRLAAEKEWHHYAALCSDHLLLDDRVGAARVRGRRAGQRGGAAPAGIHPAGRLRGPPVPPAVRGRPGSPAGRRSAGHPGETARVFV